MRTLLLIGCSAALLAACDTTATQPTPPPVDDDGSLLGTLGNAGGAADSYLENGSMEGEEGWWFHAPSGYEAAYASGEAVSGSRSARVRADARSGPDVFAFAGQSVEVSDAGSKRYLLTVQVKLDGVEGQGVAIALRGDDTTTPSGSAEAFATTEGRIAIAGSADWTEYSVELDHLPPDVRSVTAYLLLLPETTGTVYFDDAEVHTSAFAPVMALQNGGFEDGTAVPDHWWSGGPGYSNFEFDWPDVDAASGKRSVSIQRSVDSPEEFGFWAQTIRADDFLEGPATLNVRIRGALAGNGIAIAIRGDDTVRPAGFAESFVTTQGDLPIAGDVDWSEYTIRMPAVPRGMRSLTVYLIYLPGTSGSVSFDEVTLDGS